MLEFELGFKKAVFSIKLKTKYTLLQGLSAEGKTYLYNLVYILSMNVPYYYCKGIDNRRLYALPTNAEYISDDLNDKVIIIDEDAIILKQKDVANILRKSNNYFIIINRDNLNYLPIDCRSIYNIAQSGKYYNLVELYTNMYTEPVGHYDVVITEDSGTGYEFFFELKRLGYNIEEVVSSQGIPNMVNKILEYSPDKSLLIIIDKSAAGLYYKDIFKVCKNRRVSILDWLSFENHILRNKYFNTIIEDTDCYSESVEQLSTKYLKEFIRYNKSSSKCLLPDSKCVDCIKKSDCKFTHYKDDFFNYPNFSNYLKQLNIKPTKSYVFGKCSTD